MLDSSSKKPEAFTGFSMWLKFYGFPKNEEEPKKLRFFLDPVS